MNIQFNLLDEPWLPGTQLDGTPVELSLHEVLLQAHRLQEVQGETSLVTAALYRLLLAVLHRVFGPKNRTTWQKLWRAGQWDKAALETYFDQWHARFNLFDANYPFYQVPDPPGKPKPLNTLALEWASGNNATLFDHTMDHNPPPITAAYAARLAVTLQTFHLAGLAGGGLPNFTDTPWARGVIILAQGDNLFETLAFNLMRYDTKNPIPGKTDDRPNWERDDPFSPKRQIPLGYLDYLTWPSRRLKLAAEYKAGQIVVTTAWLAQGLSLAPEVNELDPMKVYRRDPQKGWRPLRFYENRVLWRDSDTLFRLRDDQTRSPKAFAWLADLLDSDLVDPISIYRYAALGMANDQAKIEFYQQQRMPLPLALLKDEQLVETLGNALQNAEEANTALYIAGKELATWFVSPVDKSKARRDDYQPILNRLNLRRRYWASLEVPFRQFIQDLPGNSETALNTWRDTVINTARHAFVQASAGFDDPIRGLKAVVLARRQLEGRLKKIKPEKTN